MLDTRNDLLSSLCFDLWNIPSVVFGISVRAQARMGQIEGSVTGIARACVAHAIAGDPSQKVVQPVEAEVIAIWLSTSISSCFHPGIFSFVFTSFLGGHCLCACVLGNVTVVLSQCTACFEVRYYSRPVPAGWQTLSLTQHSKTTNTMRWSVPRYLLTHSW